MMKKNAVITPLKLKMMILLFTLLSLISTTALWSVEAEIVSIEEEFLIKKSVKDLYIKALQTRDFALMEKICIPEAKLMSAGRDGKLHVTTLKTWSKRFDPKNPPFKKTGCLYSENMVQTI